jgi:hypothetical protein
VKKLVLSLSLALSLSGCAAALPILGGLSSVGSGISASSDKVLLEGTTALTIATDAYTGVATLVTAAVNHGAFTPTQLQMISTLNDQALKLINGADTSLSAAERAASLGLIVTQLHSILGK